MLLVLELIFIFLLSIVFYQDVKERKVSLWLLVLGICLGGLLHYLQQNNIVFVSNIVVNFIFIILVLGVLWAYAKFKLKKKLQEVFGMGDALFFLLLAASLPILSFLIVFVFSLLFSLTVFIIFKNKLSDKTVPLAGLQSLFLGLIFIINKLMPQINLYAM